MKKAPDQTKLTDKQILAACKKTRQRCNRMTDEERRQLKDKGLALIYGHDAKAFPRRG